MKNPATALVDDIALKFFFNEKEKKELEALMLTRLIGIGATTGVTRNHIRSLPSSFAVEQIYLENTHKRSFMLMKQLRESGLIKDHTENVNDIEETTSFIYAVKMPL